MREKVSEATAFLKSGDSWKAVAACGILVFIFLATEYRLELLTWRRAAVFCVLYTLILTGVFLALRSVNWIVADLFYGLVAVFVYIAAASGWLIRDISVKGGSSRRLGYIVFNDDWRQADEYLFRHWRWYDGILAVLPVFLILLGFLLFRKLNTPRGRLNTIMGVLLVPVGLGPGLDRRVNLARPLRDFCRQIALQRADTRFQKQFSGSADFPAAGKRRFPVKMWVHRTNSAEKLNALFDKFGGFELDVVFHNEGGGYFDVTHPPAPSIGLTLDKYFSSQPAIATKCFWLDFKNLTPEDAELALKRLNATADKFKLKKRLIVESPNPELLGGFSEAGFYTSFYLPIKGPEQTESAWSREVAARLEHSLVDSVSTPEDQYESLVRYKHFFDYDVLVWNLSDPYVAEVDPRINVLLVEQHTPFDR